MYLVRTNRPRTPEVHIHIDFAPSLCSSSPHLLTLLLVLAAPAAAAQGASEPERWDAQAEFSFTDQSGNSTIRVLTGGLNASHLQEDRFRLDAGVESRYGRSEGELVALSHQGTFAFDFRPTSTWSPFLFTDAERDQFKRLDLRLSTGAGAKYTFRRSEEGNRETSLSLAVLHAYERIGPQEQSAEVPVPGGTVSSHRARWSLRARTSHELRDGVTFRHTTFYQPLWDDVANYLLRSDTGAQILLTERLALSVNYQLKRDARPPQGVEPDDRLFKTGLIIDF
ncbi:MAG: DUF481 domain-containing protein [Gemmatimonadota bacterium]